MLDLYSVRLGAQGYPQFLNSSILRFRLMSAWSTH